MNILVIGGTRYIGVHLVKHLLTDGHEVTIATRGQTLDTFDSDINRIILERTSAESILNALSDKHFDIVYDSLAYCSNEIKYLLDVLKCERYIETSTMSVYQEFKDSLSEDDFNPDSYQLKWCSRSDFSYDEIKRQAECALFQIYSNNISTVAVRFPYVLGEDDYTKRLYFYVEHIVKSIPLHIDNLTEKMAFINSDEAGKFLAWLANRDFNGCINAASYGSVSLSEIFNYVEKKTSRKVILSNDGDKAPYNGTPEYSLNLHKAEGIGFQFSHLDTWLYDLLDTYINTAMAAP